MARSKKAKTPQKAVQATSTKTKLPTGKSKANDTNNVKVKASEKSAQKPTVAHQSKKAMAKPGSMPKNPALKKKTLPLIPSKETGTSQSTVKWKDNTALLKTANGAPTLAFGKLEQLDLRKAIGLLYMLNETPQEASENEMPAFLDEEEQGSNARALSLSREKELAGIFAFLAAASDDPRKVAALCLEESPNHDSLSIKIASNHSDLVQIKAGLDRIARMLKAGHEGKSHFHHVHILERLQSSMLTCLTDTTADLQSSLLEAIVSLKQNCILGRLRSCHAKSKSSFRKQKLAKPKILPTLAQMFEQQKNGGKNLNSLSSDINNLENLFTKLESLKSIDAASAPGLQITLSILQTIHHLCHNSDFDVLLLSRALRLSLEKLSRYVSASVDLIRAARRYSFFADVSVEIVKLEPLPNVQYTPPEDFFESLIARLSLKTTPAQLLSSLNCQGAAAEAEKRSAATRTLSELMNANCAVHAEIQLLFHYEFHVPQRLIPRVICSTKKACYLCNLFFSIHGRFYMPSTHGRVYEKWTLPNRVRDLRGSRLNRVIANFSRAVTEVIRQLVAMSSKKSYHPNESAFFFRSGIWSSVTKLSQRSFQLSQAAIHASPPRLVAEDATAPVSRPLEPSLRDLNEGDTTLHTLPPSTSAAERAELRSSPNSRSTKTSTTAVPPCAMALHRLKPGTSLLLELGNPSHPVRVETAHMHVDLTRDIPISDMSTSNNEQGRHSPEPAWAALDLLMTADEHSRISSSDVASIDVAALAPGAHVTLDQHVAGRGLCGFYMVCGAEALLVRCWKGMGPMDVEVKDVGGEREGEGGGESLSTLAPPSSPLHLS
jgi:hypothetical protein